METDLKLPQVSIEFPAFGDFAKVKVGCLLLCIFFIYISETIRAFYLFMAVTVSL